MVCGGLLINEDYEGSRFPNVAWYCDGCGAFLNIQIGFTDLRDTWKCTECGYVNPIDESEIWNDEGEEDEKIEEIFPLSEFDLRQYECETVRVITTDGEEYIGIRAHEIKEIEEI